MIFGFLPHTECALNNFFFIGRPKFEVYGGCFWVHMYTYNVFFEKFPSFISFRNVKK